MKRIFIDTNVLVDLVLERKDFIKMQEDYLTFVKKEG